MADCQPDDSHFMSVLFYVAWTVWTLAFGLAGIFALPSAKACKTLIWIWNSGSLALTRVLMNMRVTLHGARPDSVAVYASKHQSALETFVLWLVLDNPAFILKKELLNIPIFGWFLARTKPIAIDRSAGKAAVEQIAAQAQQRLAQGRNIVIFPEGTRRRVGAAPKYKSGGVWALYQLGMPLVPVALNTGTLWPKHGKKQAGEAQIVFLPPLPEGLTKDKFMHELEMVIEYESAKLNTR